MKKVTTISVIVLLALIWVIPVSAITGGQPDGADHPNVGAILVEHPTEGPFEICTGTLVHPRVLLTAGHCTVFLSSLLGAGSVDQVYVSFSPDEALNSKTWRAAAEVITHPDYFWGPTSDPHDVGAIVLKKSVRKVQLATLPEQGLLDELEAAGALKKGSKRAKFTVVGYGTLLEWPPPKFVDPEGVRYAAESEFSSLHEAWLYMSQNQATGNGGTCFGDSGGPAFWADPDTGAEILVGITSWGDAVCVSTGIDYRVDIAATLDFIQQVISDLD